MFPLYLNKMIEIETSRPKQFREYLEVISTVHEEPNLVFTPDGLSILVMDPSHICMVNLMLPSSYFDTYHIPNEETVGVSLPTLLKGLSKINKDDQLLRLVYDYDAEIKEVATKNLVNQDTQETTLTQTKINETIKLTLISDINRVKTFKCLEPLDEEVPQPKIWFKSKTRIVMKTLKRILDDYKDNLAHVTFTSTDNGLRIWGETDEYSESVTLTRDNDNMIEHRIDDDSSTTFTMDYLIKFLAKAIKVSEVVAVRFSDNMPLNLNVEIPQGKLEYFVAPCINI